MKIRLHGYITVSDEDLDRVRGALAEHIRLTRQELGCLRFEVDPDAADPNRFNVYEEFIDRRAFERHQVRVRTSTWGDVSANASRHYQIDEFE